MGSSIRRRSQAGFSLLELIVVMSILAVLAGAAIPVVSKSLTRSRNTDTRARLQRLESAILAYFEDTAQFPPTFNDLEENKSKADGWVGPYLRALTAGAVGSDTALDKDAWGQTYEVKAEGKSALRISSNGPDGKKDKENKLVDDLVVSVDVTPVRRLQTLAELAQVNAAIEAYNKTNLPKKPLPKKLKDVLKELAKGGYLPDDTDAWDEDAWGTAYEPEPKGGPIMGLASKNLDK